MAPQALPKQPFQPFSKTRRPSQSKEILDGFFNDIRATLPDAPTEF
jgi:hypothetical protein